jgi:hypothetical protein
LLLLAILCALPTPSCGAREPGPAPASTRAYDANGRATRAVAARPERPNVIVLTIGALRADAVQLDLEGGGDMPSLVRLARESVSFAEASSCSSSTLPALASLFTGRAPHQHGVQADSIREPELESLATWAEVMRSTLGYQTAAFFEGLPPALATPLCAGFESVTGGFELQQAPALLDAWAATRQADRPFFLFLHSSDAQAPYGEANHPNGGLRTSPRALAALEALGPDPSGSELVRRALLDGEQGLLLATHPGLRAQRDTLTRHLWAGLVAQPEPGLRRSARGAYRAGLRWVDGLLQQTLDLAARAACWRTRSWS